MASGSHDASPPKLRTRRQPNVPLLGLLRTCVACEMLLATRLAISRECTHIAPEKSACSLRWNAGGDWWRSVPCGFCASGFAQGLAPAFLEQQQCLVVWSMRKFSIRAEASPETGLFDRGSAASVCSVGQGSGVSRLLSADTRTKWQMFPPPRTGSNGAEKEDRDLLALTRKMQVRTNTKTPGSDGGIIDMFRMVHGIQAAAGVSPTNIREQERRLKPASTCSCAAALIYKQVLFTGALYAVCRTPSQQRNEKVH